MDQIQWYAPQTEHVFQETTVNVTKDLQDRSVKYQYVLELTEQTYQCVPIVMEHVYRIIHANVMKVIQDRNVKHRFVLVSVLHLIFHAPQMENV